MRVIEKRIINSMEQDGFLPKMEIEAEQTALDRKLAPLMFVLTLTWLAVLGAGMHMLQDEAMRYALGAQICGGILVVFWIAYLLEAWIHWRSDGVFRRFDLLICLFPPLRLGGRDHVHGRTVWVPFLGWKDAGDELADDLEIRLSYTMIAVALMVLPLLGFEHFYGLKIQENRNLGMAVQFAQAFIWFAFAAEFVLMISLVKKKIHFAKEHWLDLLIICLPMIAFMRLFRLTGAARLTRLSKTARVFRLRGTAMRAWRAILILKIVDRLLHRDPQKRIQILQEQLAQKKQDVVDLEAEIEAIRQRIWASEQMESRLSNESQATETN